VSSRALQHAEEPALDHEMRELVEQLCVPGAIKIVVQPVVRPGDQVIVGYEALARMSLEPAHPPDWWLERAEELGLRRKLEIACLAAIARLGPLPEGRLLFINISPSTLSDPAALALVCSLPGRVVVELTEQEAVIDYAELRGHLTRWLSQGLRIAIDDAGAGYSSLRHVIELSPDFLKLDRELVRGIDEDRTRRALVRSVLAFAREVGTSVIAEGIETSRELEVLRDAGVNLVQGYLLARPGPPWPSIAMAGAGHEPAANPALDRLHESLVQAKDVRGACSAVAEYLFRQGEMMPSVYLERHGELRCMAQRGLWQVLDGMPGSAGITGRTWKLGKPVVVPDVRLDPHYLEAIPGVVAEICVPVGTGPKPLGALNVESLVPLPPGTLQLLERCAELLSLRLGEIGRAVDDSAWQRAVKASVAISGVTGGGQAAKLLLGHLSAAARLDSAALVLDGPEGKRVTAAIGPLAGPLSGLGIDEIDALSSLVGDIRSCYTAGDASGRGFAGTGSLRDGGARAVVVLPLWARRRRLGSILLAHSRPVQLTSDDVTPLEMLSDHIASALAPGRGTSGTTVGSTPDLSATAPLAQVRHEEAALQPSSTQRP
jgi:EAL domain-containing protein (putative c-di-GMP-specific phosphodiesterase class I)/putative methionine-R-sulfoxide reductase with GAF domain